MAQTLKHNGGVTSNGQNKHADFSATGSVPDATLGASTKGTKVSMPQVSAVQASWGYLTASDFPDKVRPSRSDEASMNCVSVCCDHIRLL